MVSFVIRQGLVLAAAGPTAYGGLRPPPPGSRRGYGDYCFRAICPVTDARGARVGIFKGFDCTPDVGRTTLAACRRHVPTLPGGSAAYSCDPDPAVVFLLHSSLQCTGQVFFEMGSNTRRVV